METKRSRGTGLQKPGLRSDEEAAIQTIAQRIGLRISAEIASVLSETIVLIREVQKQAAPSGVLAESDILTAADVARRLKISKSKAYQLIKQQDLRSISMGRTVRVRRKDLEDFITERASAIRMFAYDL